MVRSEAERSQFRNKELALALLTSRLWSAERERAVAATAADRKQQIGSGMRGDKRRTVRERDDQVNDHITGQKWTYRDYVRGNW
jgi:peptide chain release factor 1